MNNPHNHFFTALALICACFLAGCKTLVDSAPKPSAQVIDSRISGLSLDSIELMFDVEVANPYTTNLPLTDLTYSLASGGSTFMDGKVTPTGSIPARGKKMIQIPATVPFRSLLTALKSVKPGAVVPYAAQFKIGVNVPVVGRMEIPLSKNGELPVPAVPQVELTSLVMNKFSFDQITASAKLKVKNTNQFALDITKMGINLALAGKEVGGSKLANMINLPAGESQSMDVSLSFSPSVVGMSLMNMLRGNQIDYQMSGLMEADTRFGPMALPFKHGGNAAVTK